MNSNIKFDGLKSVTINGKEFEIASVDIHGAENGLVGVTVKLAGAAHISNLCMIFQKEKK